LADKAQQVWLAAALQQPRLLVGHRQAWAWLQQGMDQLLQPQQAALPLVLRWVTRLCEPALSMPPPSVLLRGTSSRRPVCCFSWSCILSIRQLVTSDRCHQVALRRVEQLCSRAKHGLAMLCSSVPQ
jgi:hypothetical protein